MDPSKQYNIKDTVSGSSLRTGYLDGWRGISIICVLLGHFTNLTIDLGNFGVCMFFSLSGMLMSNLLFMERQSLPKFYRRRISRIFPVFFFFVISMFVLSNLREKSFAWSEFISTLLFLRTYFPFPGIWQTGVPIGHLWSLNVEEHAYLFMSLLTLIPMIRNREGLFLVACGSICIMTGFIYVRLGNDAPFWGALGSEVAASYLMVSAGYRLFRGRIKCWIPPWFSILALFATFFIGQYAPWWMPSMVSPFLLALAINHLPESYKWFQETLSSKTLCQIGLWSFSIYVWQQPFYSVKLEFPGGPSAALACAVIISILSFYIIEQPSRTWLNKNWNSWHLFRSIERPGKGPR